MALVLGPCADAAAWARALEGVPHADALAPCDEGKRGHAADAQAAAVPLAMPAVGTSAPEATLVVFATALARFCAHDEVRVGVLAENGAPTTTRLLVANIAKWEAKGTTLADAAREAHERRACSTSNGESHTSPPPFTWSEVVEQAGGETDPFRHPLFQAAFVWHARPPEGMGSLVDDRGPDERRLSGVVPFLPKPLVDGHLDVRLDVWNAKEGGFKASVTYRPDVWSQEIAMLFAAAVRRAWAGYVACAGLSTPAALPMMNENQMERLVTKGTPALANEQGITMHGLIARNAALHAFSDRPSITLDPYSPGTEGHGEYNPVASRSSARKYTYAEFLADVRTVASQLCVLGVTVDVGVPLVLDKGYDLLLAVHATLRAGGAYIPIDPSYPHERIQCMLEDAAYVGGNNLLITQSQFLSRFGDGEGMCTFPGDILSIDHRESWNVEGDVDLLPFDGALEQGNVPKKRTSIVQSIAANLSRRDLPYEPNEIDRSMVYVLFTSGTTGRPKGCMVPHRGLVRRNKWLCNTFDLGTTPGDTILQKTPYVFGVSEWELFWPFVCGATLVVPQPQVHKDTSAVFSLLYHHGCAACWFVPSQLSMIVDFAQNTPLRRIDQEASDTTQDTAHLPMLRHVLMCGEALSPHLCATVYNSKVVPRGTIHNVYGPTEGDITHYAVPSRGTLHAMLVGQPCGASVFVLDKHLHFVPVGAVGEICFAGTGLALGYVNNEQKTSEAFIPNPYGPGEIYRTGDLGKWTADGNLRCLGRRDHQVKIRGFRIELGDVESALVALDMVQHAAVIVDGSESSSRLVAYVSSYLPAADAADGGIYGAEAESYAKTVKQSVEKKLPPYMVPSLFIPLPKMPFNVNGKLDRKQLIPIAEYQKQKAKHRQAASQPSSNDVSAETSSAPDDLMREVAEIFQEVLQLPDLPLADDDFETIGGNSLLAGKVTNRLRQLYPQLSIPGTDIYQNSTPEAMARLLASKLAESTSENNESKASPNPRLRAASIGDHTGTLGRAMHEAMLRRKARNRPSKQQSINPIFEMDEEAAAGATAPYPKAKGTDAERGGPIVQGGRECSYACMLAQLLAFVLEMCVDEFSGVPGYVVGWYIYSTYGKWWLYVSLPLLEIFNLLLEVFVAFVMYTAVRPRNRSSRDASYPLWGRMYFWHWCAGSLVDQVAQDISHYTAGTPILPAFYSLFGARMGANVNIEHGVTISNPWLVSIGDRTTLAYESNIFTSHVKQGTYHTSKVHVSPLCHVGARAVVTPGTDLPPGSAVGALSSTSPLGKNYDVKVNTHRLAELNDIAGDCEGAQPGLRVFVGIPFLLVLDALPYIPLVEFLIWFHGVLQNTSLSEVDETLPYLVLLASIPLVGNLLMNETYFFIAVAVKRLIIGDFTSDCNSDRTTYKSSVRLHPRGVKHQDGEDVLVRSAWEHFRMWLWNGIVNSEPFNDALEPWISTEVLSWKYRLLGARISPGVQIDYFHANGLYELISVEHNVTFGSATTLLPSSRVDGVRLPITVEEHANVLDHSVVLEGVLCERGSVLGTSTLARKRSTINEFSVNTGNVGGHCIQLRVKPHTKGGSIVANLTGLERQAHNNHHNALRWLSFNFWCAFIAIVITPMSEAVEVGSLFLDYIIVDRLLGVSTTNLFGFAVHAVLLLPIINLCVLLVELALVVLLKNVVIGRYKTGDHAFYSSYHFRWCFMIALMNSIDGFISTAAGTPFLVWFARAMGARVGKGVWLGEFGTTEYDLLRIDDFASVGDDCDISAHTVENMVIKLRPISVGSASTMRSGSVLMPGAILEAGGDLLEQAQVLKGEVVLCGETYAGLPARRVLAGGGGGGGCAAPLGGAKAACASPRASFSPFRNPLAAPPPSGGARAL